MLGVWTNSFALGTCGVDTNAHTAWAVVNQACEFAVGALPHLSAYRVNVRTSGRGTATPVSTNVTFMTDLVITAAALPYSFISDNLDDLCARPFDRLRVLRATPLCLVRKKAVPRLRLVTALQSCFATWPHTIFAKNESWSGVTLT